MLSIPRLVPDGDLEDSQSEPTRLRRDLRAELEPLAPQIHRAQQRGRKGLVAGGFVGEPCAVKEPDTKIQAAHAEVERVPPVPPRAFRLPVPRPIDHALAPDSNGSIRRG